MTAIGGPPWRHGEDIDWLPSAVSRREGVTVSALIALLEQLPGEALVEVSGDEIVPPSLDVFTSGRGRVRLLNPNWPHEVDHTNGQITR